MCPYLPSPGLPLMPLALVSLYIGANTRAALLNWVAAFAFSALGSGQTPRRLAPVCATCRMSACPCAMTRRCVVVVYLSGVCSGSSGRFPDLVKAIHSIGGGSGGRGAVCNVFVAIVSVSNAPSHKTPIRPRTIREFVVRVRPNRRMERNPSAASSKDAQKMCR